MTQASRIIRIRKSNRDPYRFETVKGYKHSMTYNGHCYEFFLAKDNCLNPKIKAGWSVYETSCGLACAWGKSRVSALEDLIRRLPRIDEIMCKADNDPMDVISRLRKEMNEYQIQSVESGLK